MKKLSIFILIGLMFIATVFLVRFQCKAIRDTIDKKQKTFETNVKTVIDQTVDKIEKKYVLSILKTEKTAASFDSINLSNDLMISLLSLDEDSAMIYNGGDKLTIINDLTNENKYYREKQLFIYHIMAFLSQSVGPVNTDKLLTEVKNELKRGFVKYHIDTFELAILDIKGNILSSTPNFTHNPQKSGEHQYFSKYLFDYDQTSSLKYKLEVYFPNENKLKYDDLYKVVVPTLGLSILILLIFSITAFFLVRQKKLSDIKNSFIHNMTHELKTPIATIKLSAEMLKDTSIELPDNVKKNLVSTIFSEASRLLFLVEKILQIAMLEKGKVIINREFHNGNKLIEETLTSFKVHFENENAEVSVNLNAKHSTILVDKLHFMNVLNNLLDNALKYKKRNIQPKISIKSYNENNEWFVVEVSDNGIGINNEDLKHIFDDFYRTQKNDVHNVKGFGLGLSYVKRIIDEFGGKVEVKSQENIGTSFILKLPYTES